MAIVDPVAVEASVGCTTTIDLKVIRTDGGTQIRAHLDEDLVAEYAEHINDLPPICVFHDGSDYWLADGFHRYHAYRKAGLDSIDAVVRSGTRRDAILSAVGANASHGLRRSNEDKRRAVETLLRDAEWSSWSDREIAKSAGVSHPFVAMLRDASSGNGFQIAASGDDKRTVSRGGKTYKQDRSGINADRLRKVPERVHEDAPGSLPAPAPTPQLQPTAASAEDDDGMLSLEETVELLRRQNAKLQALVGGESDTAALIDELNDEIAGLKGENHTLETQRDAFMNESAQLKREIKAVGRENVTLRESVSGVPEHLTRRHRQGPRERLEH